GQPCTGSVAGSSRLAGGIAIKSVDRDERAHVTMETTERLDISTGRGRLRFVAAGVGALGLGLQVLWTHLFAQVLHNSVYSFTAVIVVFLIAIASGAALAAFMLRRAAPS